MAHKVSEILPKPTVLTRQHWIPIDNTPEQIIYVNENPGEKINLLVRNTGFLESWYYGQTVDGRFYKQVFIGFDRKEEIYYLDKPIDPNDVCASLINEIMKTFYQISS
jgi:hypothetical protein